MSFKDELEKILAEFGRKCSPVATLKNVDNPLVRPEHIETASTSIIDLVDKEVIGKDENEFDTRLSLVEANIRGFKNDLRAEQRAKLKEDK